MSTWDKLLLKLHLLSRDIRFNELRKILENYGYTMSMPKSGGSHCTFRKPGCKPITIPKHEPIKRIYIALVKQIVESEDAKNENTR